MPDSVREKIIQNFEASLKMALVSNGYNTNIGQNVLRTRIIGNIELTPAIALAALPSVPGDSQFMGVSSFIMPLQIFGSVAIMPSTDRTTNVENISMLGDQILADIQQSVGFVDTDTPGAGITKIMFDGGVDQQAETQNNDAVVEVGVQYSVSYVTILDNPYSQP